MRFMKRLCPVAAAIVILTGCIFTIPSQAVTGSEAAAGGSAAIERGVINGSGMQNPAEVSLAYDANYDESAADGSNGAYIDTSSVSEGYVAVSATSSSRLKFQVLKGDATYNYDLSSDGTPSIFPLQCGDGTYTFRVMENIVDKKYAELYTTSCDVSLESGFAPFLRPSDYVRFSDDSKCVRKASELAASSQDDLELIGKVYQFVTSNVKYDKEKATSVKAGYLPDPDTTMVTGMGICFDYASLAGAMLRSQGIPTKEIFGYVSPNDVYHAWNMFYTEKTGWVVASFEVKGTGWNRLDLTFAAGGAPSSFVGDGSNYSDLYTY